MKKIWIVLLTVAMVGALLAVPGTAVAKPGHGKPPTTTPNFCLDGSFPLEVGEATFDCARLTDLGGVWTFTFSGYTGRVGSLVTQLRKSIPGDRCNGHLELYSATDTLLFSGTGSGFSFRRIEAGEYYQLDTSEMDGDCVVFSVGLKKAMHNTITITVGFTAA